MKRIQVVDSHTGGEPTRIIVSGGPELGTGSMEERLQIFERDFDEIRRATIDEPRGSDVLVGGLLCEPVDPKASAGIIFFNTAGFLGMCGHGTIGLMVTLKHLGKIDDGTHLIETPVGAVEAKLNGSNVSVRNVLSFRYLADVQVNVPEYGQVTGDVAWGGNWFFLVKDSPEQLVIGNVDRLTKVTKQIRDALDDQKITGMDGAYIDHVELFGPAEKPENQSRNFVLCPGGAYDRSPCGTGTSAKLACLHASGVLAEGEIWNQESIVGSVFEGSFEIADKGSYEITDAEFIFPTISGSAYVNGESTLLLDPRDPFCMGIPK